MIDYMHRLTHAHHTPFSFIFFTAAGLLIFDFPFFRCSWWKRTGLGQKLDFIRDRLPTSFLWALAMSCSHQHGYFRTHLAKVIQFITLLDDVYDVYGTLEELELFTSVVERFVVYIDMN